MDFYYFSLCHVCKEHKPDLKKCSSCKVVHYCCKEHQRKDWPKHKEICKVITKTRNFVVPPLSGNAKDFDQYKFSVSLLWHMGVDRPLTHAEHHMWMFPKVCATCYSNDVTIICEQCLSVAYCSNTHKNSDKSKHEKYCDALKLCMATQRFIFEDKDWANWLNYKINPDAKSLPKNFLEVINILGLDLQPGAMKRPENILPSSYFLAPAINIIHALERAGFIQNRRGKKSRITIHVVGPDEAESKMCWPVILEFLSHWIFNLKGVKLFLVGPHAYDGATVKMNFNCDECKAKKFTGIICTIEGFYHHHIEALSRPDLIVVFNSGFHEFIDNIKDTWKESIPKLISFRGVPSILTAYTETELKRDIDRFDKTHLKFLLEPQRNPYANLRPIRNWQEVDEPIFYENNYVAIVTRK